MLPRFPKHARVAPVEPPYDPETTAALDALGPPIALFRVLARRPERARGVNGWGRYILRLPLEPGTAPLPRPGEDVSAAASAPQRGR